MEGIMPMSFALTGVNTQAIGYSIQQSLLPILTAIRNQLIEMSHANVFQAAQVAFEMNGLRYVGLQVYVINPDLTENIAATRWAVANLSYVQMVELIPIIEGTYRRLGLIIDILERMLTGIFDVLNTGLARICDWLRNIWGRLGKGIELTFNFKISAESSVNLTNLAAVLAMITGFTIGLRLILATFTETTIEALKAVTKFVEVMTTLITTIKGYGGWDLAKIAAGLAGILGFVGALTAILNKLDVEVLKALPNLIALFDAITKLMTTIKDFGVWSMGKIAAGFVGIVKFVGGLTEALNQLNVEVLKALPNLIALFDALIHLMNVLAKYKDAELKRIGEGFSKIASFLRELGLALVPFKADILDSVSKLDGLFNALIHLMNVLAKYKDEQFKRIGEGFNKIASFLKELGLALLPFKADILDSVSKLGDLFDALIRLMNALVKFKDEELKRIGEGFLFIDLFVLGLGLALRTFDDDAIKAIPALSELFDTLIKLADAIATFDKEGMLPTIGLSFLAIAGFVWALAAALVYAAGPLESLARIFESIEKILDKVTQLGSGLLGILGKIGPLLPGGVGGLLGGLLGGEDISSLLKGAILGPLGSWGFDKLKGLISYQGGPGNAPGAGMTGGLMLASMSSFAGMESNRPSLIQAATMTSPLMTGPGTPVAGMGQPQLDQSVTVHGGISITINTQKLDTDSPKYLGEEFLRQVQEGLGKLSRNQDFCTGIRCTSTLQA